MSDAATLQAYARGAERYSADWLAQPTPTDLHVLLETYFLRNGVTADIGCGNGREVAWLNARGYPAIGYDAAPDLLAEARRQFPDNTFREACLPDLAAIATGFDNVICETVIMHLPSVEIPEALCNLRRILKPRGTLYLSWRVTEGADQRDAAGRLYSAFDAALVTDPLQGCEILHFSDTTSLSSGKHICRVVARKP